MGKDCFHCHFPLPRSLLLGLSLFACLSSFCLPFYLVLTLFQEEEQDFADCVDFIIAQERHKEVDPEALFTEVRYCQTRKSFFLVRISPGHTPTHGDM